MQAIKLEYFYYKIYLLNFDILRMKIIIQKNFLILFSIINFNLYILILI